MGLSDEEIGALFEAAQGGQQNRLSDDQIAELWDQHNQGWSPVESAIQFGSGAIEGTAGLAALSTDLMSPLLDPFNMLGMRAGIKKDEKGNYGLSLPSSELASKLVSENLPAKEDEYRYARTLGQFVGPGGIAKGGAKIAGTALSPLAEKILGSVVSNAFAGTGAQVAEDVTGDTAIAPLVGAGIFGSMPSIFRNLGTTARSVFRGATPEEAKGSAALFLKQATDLSPEKIEQAIAAAPKDDLGKLMTTAEVTGDAGMAQIEKTLAAKDQQAIQYAQRGQARSDARDAIVQSLADVPSVNPERLGTDLIAKAAETESNYANIAQQMWDQVPRRTPISVSAEQKAVKSILSSRQGGLAPNSKVSTLVSQFLETDKTKKSGVLTSGALQDIRSDALTLMRDANVTPLETRLLGAIQGGADSAMERSLTGEAYDTWKAARATTATQKETFGRGTAGGALVGDNARPSTVLGTAIKGDKQSIDELSRAIGGDSSLFEGVKRAMLDSIKRDSQDNLTLFQTRKFIGQNEGALQSLLGDDGLNSLKRIADDLKSEAKVQLTANLASKGNSVTAQKETVAGAIDQLLSESIVPGTGPLATLANSVREAVGIRDKSAVREMIFKAALNPEFALELAKTPSTTRIFNMLERLRTLGRDAMTAGGRSAVLELGRTEEEKKKMPGSLRSQLAPQALREQEPKGRDLVLRGAGFLQNRSQGTPTASQTNAAGSRNSAKLEFPSPQTTTKGSAIEAIFEPISYRGDAVQNPKDDGELDVLLEAIRQVESSGGKYTTGPKTKYGTAKGSYQVLDSTGKEYFEKLGLEGKYDPYDEKQQKQIAKAILLDYMRMFDGDINKAITAYHTGPGNVKKGEIGPQGKAYLPKVEAVFNKLLEA